MTTEHFDFYGIRVEMIAERSSDTLATDALKVLTDEFQHFRSNEDGGLNLRLRLATAPGGPRRNWAGPAFRTRMCRAHVRWGIRICDYADGDLIVSRRLGKIREFEVRGASPDAMIEIAYMAVLSAVGEALDQRGWHRVHALGFSHRDRGALVVLPQGGGKSAIAAQLLSDPAFKIHSDEIPLLKDNCLRTFPIRMALKPDVLDVLGLNPTRQRLFRRKRFPAKAVFPIPPEKIAAPANLDLLVLGRRAGPGRKPRLRKASRVFAFSQLFLACVVGLGLPQMAEHMLRLDARLIRISWSRLRTAWKASACRHRYVMELSADARTNAALLKSFLNGELK